MDIEKWEAYHIHARHFYEDSKVKELSAQNRCFLAVNASEFILKALYYKLIPDGNVRGHISSKLLNRICSQLGISSPFTVSEAAKRLKEHYFASRYPENTSEFFCEPTRMEIACQHYPDELEPILNDVKIIFEWAERQLYA